MEAYLVPLPNPRALCGGSAVVLGEPLPFTLEDAYDAVQAADGVKGHVEAPAPAMTVGTDSETPERDGGTVVISVATTDSANPGGID